MPDLTYAQLSQATTALAKDITRSTEILRGHADQIAEEARDTARLAEQIGALRVDSATVAETRDLATLLGGVAAAALDYAEAGDTTARAAQAAQEQNQASHARIGEAINRSPVGSEVYDIDPAWFAQD